jgi:hypothetical protein
MGREGDDMSDAAATMRALRWLAGVAGRIDELKARVDAEVNMRIATHPDLADLDDWLDDYYAKSGVEW